MRDDWGSVVFEPPRREGGKAWVTLERNHGILGTHGMVFGGLKKGLNHEK